MCYAVSLIVLSQSFTIPFINDRENSCRLEYHVSKNSWSWLPIVGSNSSFKLLGISFDSMHCDKNYLWDWYRALYIYIYIYIYGCICICIYLWFSFDTKLDGGRILKFLLQQECPPWVLVLHVLLPPSLLFNIVCRLSLKSKEMERWLVITFCWFFGKNNIIKKPKSQFLVKCSCYILNYLISFT